MNKFFITVITAIILLFTINSKGRIISKIIPNSECWYAYEYRVNIDQPKPWIELKKGIEIGIKTSEPLVFIWSSSQNSNGLIDAEKLSLLTNNLEKRGHEFSFPKSAQSREMEIALAFEYWNFLLDKVIPNTGLKLSSIMSKENTLFNPLRQRRGTKETIIEYQKKFSDNLSLCQKSRRKDCYKARISLSPKMHPVNNFTKRHGTGRSADINIPKPVEGYAYGVMKNKLIRFKVAIQYKLNKKYKPTMKEVNSFNRGCPQSIE